MIPLAYRFAGTGKAGLILVTVPSNTFPVPIHVKPPVALITRCLLAAMWKCGQPETVILEIVVTEATFAGKRAEFSQG